MIKLYDEASGKECGTIPEAQLQFMIDQLEEESLEDTGYYINRSTIDAFQQAGADPQLVALLRHALGNRQDMDIRWERA